MASGLPVQANLNLRSARLQGPTLSFSTTFQGLRRSRISKQHLASSWESPSNTLLPAYSPRIRVLAMHASYPRYQRSLVGKGMIHLTI